MSFTAVSAGELIKASIANANWRHVGRLGADLIPFTVAGAGVDDTWDIGSLTYQWKDIYFSGKLYQNGSEFVAGGGGGGGGLEVLAIANALEKQGQSYPLPNDYNVRNSFVDNTEMMLYLRKSYVVGDTTSMIADHGTASELATINDFETVGDFTAGTSTPTVAADAVNFLENTQSVKFTATSLNGSADMYDGVTLSLTDKHFRVSVRPDTLSNVSYVYVVLYTASGHQRKFNFAAADLTAATWNHLTCDLDAVVDGTIIVDTGTFVRSTITRIYYGITTTSAQTVVPSFDLARTISSQPLLIPSYGLSFTIQSDTVQDSFTIISEDRTGNTTKGSFTIDNTLDNGYTNINSTDYASTTTGTIENNQFIHKSTASGQNAKTAKQHEVKLLPTTMATATLESFLRFYDDAFEVDEFPTTGTINLKELSAAATEKGRFLDNDYILLFKKLRHGRGNQSPEGSYTANFLRLQLNANAGDSSALITLSHDGSNSVGADTTGYYVVPESAYLEYSAGAKTASTFTQAVPGEFLLNKIEIEKFADNFDRANGTIGNDWTAATDYISAGSLTWAIASNQAQVSVNNQTSISRLYRNKEDYNFRNPYEITGDFTLNIATIDHKCALSIGSLQSTFYSGDTHNITPTNNHGITIYFKWRTNSATTNQIILYSGATAVKTVSFSYSASTQHHYRIKTNKKNVKVKLWTGAVEPDGWNIDEEYSYNIPGNYFMFGSSLTDSGVEETQFDNLVINEDSNGYTLKYKIEDLTDVDKAETITTLKRGDTTNQNPTLEETATTLY